VIRHVFGDGEVVLGSAARDIIEYALFLGARSFRKPLTARCAALSYYYSKGLVSGSVSWQYMVRPNIKSVRGLESHKALKSFSQFFRYESAQSLSY